MLDFNMVFGSILIVTGLGFAFWHLGVKKKVWSDCISGVAICSFLVFMGSTKILLGV